MSSPPSQPVPESASSHDGELLRRVCCYVTTLVLDARLGERPADDNALFGVSRDEVLATLDASRDEVLGDVAGRDALEGAPSFAVVLEQIVRDEQLPLERLRRLTRGAQLSIADLALLSVIVAVQLQPDLARCARYLVGNRAQADTITSLTWLLAGRDTHAQAHLGARLCEDAPLVRHGVLHLASWRTPDGRPRPASERTVMLDGRVLWWLCQIDATGQQSPALTSCANWRHVADDDALELPEATAQALFGIARSGRFPLAVAGEHASTRWRVIERLSQMRMSPLLEVSVDTLLEGRVDEVEARLRALSLEILLSDALIVVRCGSTPRCDASGLVALGRLVDWVATAPQVVFSVPDAHAWAEPLSGCHWLTAARLDATERAAAWRDAFARSAVAATTELVDEIAARYVLSLADIRTIVVEVASRPSTPTALRTAIEAACRERLVRSVSAFATVLPTTTFGRDDLVLPQRERDRFEEMMAFADAREVLFDDWGFGQKFPYGRGLSVLFYGPPGTGKTMAASIVARQLEQPLLRVDVSRIVSKYVGETEKHLRALFDEAERTGVVLLFDEADSLFSARTSVRGATDRYANLEVNYLLERMEAFDGVAVLTTNAEKSLDEAFKRRLRYRIYFPVPDASTRARLWQRQLPDDAPLADDIDFDLLGEAFEMSGGHIKSAVLRAALDAWRHRRDIGMRELARAAAAEMREQGKLTHATSLLGDLLSDEGSETLSSWEV